MASNVPAARKARADSRNRLARNLAALAVCALLFLLVIVFYRRIALTNLIVVDYDLLTYFYPYKEAAAAALREGRLPLWNPFLFTGVPFMANPQTALFYVPNLPGYALSAPLAVKYSILFHIFLAGIFTFAFARLSLGLGKTGSLVAALSFMFGGFLTQQVGHINQLNAAVWLPLILLLFDLASRRKQPLFALLGGLALSAQVLAGHSQESFLLLVGFGLYAAFRLGEFLIQRRQHGHGALIWGVVAFALIAGTGAGLSALQLLPTFELSRESIRGGGLPYREAVTFSLPPWLLARSLLPAFKDNPFSEYIAYSGTIPLFLAAYALRKGGPLRMAVFWLGLALLALFLALGAFNPLYELIYRLAPPLRLFRVPARWLYLYAFAIAVLAGIGADRLLASCVPRVLRRHVLHRRIVDTHVVDGRVLDSRGFPARTARLTGLANPRPAWPRSLLSTAIWSAAGIVPVWLIQQAAVPTRDAASPEVFWAWVGLIVLAASVVHFLPRLPTAPARAAVLLVLIAGELLVAGSFVNDKNITAPQGDDSLRPTVAQLLQDPGLHRVLSISRTDFEPGDKGELQSIFRRTLDEDAVYQLLVAMKHQEAMSPNVPMKYGLATLDGYDGGVLPLRRYVNFKSLLLDGVPLRETATSRPNQSDALLRDQLAGVPDASLLGLLNVKYIITDKQADLWIDNVYYDLSTPVSLPPGGAPVTLRPAGFEATSLGVIFQLPDGQNPPASVAEVILQGRSGRSFRGTISPQTGQNLPMPRSYLVRLDLDQSLDPQEINFRYLGSQAGFVLKGVSLIDRRTGASEPVALDALLRPVHSGDLKIYENLRWQPRAFVAQRATWTSDDQLALEIMRRKVKAGQLGVAETPVLLFGVPPAGLQADLAPSTTAGGQARILKYEPERVIVQADMASDGYLVLTDSYYPGWRAYIDGQEAAIYRAEYLFRAVHVPVGAHQVEFRYEPDSFRWGATLSLATLLIMALAAAGWVLYRMRGAATSGDPKNPNPSLPAEGSFYD